MLLPFDSVMNLMYTAVPIYEWEPVPAAEVQPSAPAAADAAGDAASGEAAGSANGIPPSLQLVFKGMRWIAVPVWTQRENAGFNQVAQDQRDEEGRRAQERARHARKEPEAAPGSAGVSGSGDAAAEGDSAV